MIDHNIVGGSIVNIASIVGKTGNMGQANYASSKAGVESMTRVASKEFGKFNIRVNAILPGFIKSPMTDKIPDKLKEMAVQHCALKRFGQPEGKRMKLLKSHGRQFSIAFLLSHSNRFNESFLFRFQKLLKSLHF